LKRVALIKSDGLDIEPFILDEFIKDKAMGKVSKKEIKKLADELGLDYDSKSVSFTKKILNAYLEKIS
jgi:hypothetical protein